MHRLAINASRARSGGAFAHLSGLLRTIDPNEYGFSEIHIWCHRDLAKVIPPRDFITVHIPGALERNIFFQILWELFILPIRLKNLNCSLLLNVDAGSFASFRKTVTMSRDMLSYEPGALQGYKIGFDLIRIHALKYIQNLSLRKAQGVIFLTEYASTVIQRSSGSVSSYKIINHGVAPDFFPPNGQIVSNEDKLKQSTRLIYVSNILPYKHHKEVLDAFELLLSWNKDLTLDLVGGGPEPYRSEFLTHLSRLGANINRVKLHEFLPRHSIINLLRKSDIVLFASSCENMPNTLLEAMAAAKPIACSDRGPMPEVLGECGLYFDPFQPHQIAMQVRVLIDHPHLAEKLSLMSTERARTYTWSNTSHATFKYLQQVRDL